MEKNFGGINMKNEITISAKSFEEAKLMAIQLVHGGLGFHAEEALYVHNLADSIADFGRFPLVIEGKLAGYPLTVKIAKVDKDTTSELLALFGFKDSDLRETQEVRFYKVFRKFD